MKNILDSKPLKYVELNSSNRYRCNFVLQSDLENKRVLDIGCGFGWFELYALDQKVKEIIGLEINEEALSTAKKYITNPNVKFMTGNAIHLPFEKEVFDTIVAWEVIEHIPKNTEKRMFQEIFRVLKPGGKLYLSTPSHSLLAKIFDPAWWLIGHRHYHYATLKKIAQETGFKLLYYEIKGQFFEMLSIINLYLSKWIFRREPFFFKYIDQQIEKEYKKSGYMTLFLCFEKISSGEISQE